MGAMIPFQTNFAQRRQVDPNSRMRRLGSATSQSRLDNNNDN
jgi:hypothetical protein